MNLPQADGHSPAGFPHSDISGSKPVSGSPELIAAFHVLHRLWLPRHSPYALCSLTLSLRHASSRARDSTRESESVALPSFNDTTRTRILLGSAASLARATPDAIAFDVSAMLMRFLSSLLPLDITIETSAPPFPSVRDRCDRRRSTSLRFLFNFQ